MPPTDYVVCFALACAPFLVLLRLWASREDVEPGLDLLAPDPHTIGAAVRALR